MSDKKMGRPTDNPKNRRITFRLDDTTFNNLETYLVYHIWFLLTMKFLKLEGETFLWKFLKHI